MTAAQITGLPQEKIEIHTQYLGGGFGRRGGADFIGEAVEIAKAVTGTPVKLTWTREDDLQHDTYRPASYTKFAAGLDAHGMPDGVHGKRGLPVFRRAFTTASIAPAWRGFATSLTTSPIFSCELSSARRRHPGELLALGGILAELLLHGELSSMSWPRPPGKDPVEFRRRLLGTDPKNARYLNVLNLAAEKAGWGKPLPAGRFRGVGMVNNLGSFNAQVAEVSVTQGKVKVHRVVGAVDCGQVINPAIVAQQIESGIVYGLSTALKIGITLESWTSRADQLQYLRSVCASMKCRWWKCTSCRARRLRAVSARPARRRLSRR